MRYSRSSSTSSPSSTSTIFPSTRLHRQHVTQVLQKLREHHLYLKLEKCEIHKSVIDHNGIQMDQKKVETILDWPLMSSFKQLQYFLGFASFY